MARLMTAEDRAPQVGDVLLYRGWLRIEVSATEDLPIHRAAHGYAFVYVSRADGGPVTVGEG